MSADCPLIDPEVVDRVIETYLNNMPNYDFVSNTIVRTYPRGLDTEVFSWDALEKIWIQADRDYQREHISIYIYEYPKFFNSYNVVHKSDLSILRWTVDEESDLKLIREIYKRLYLNENIFLMKNILDVLEKEPFLKNINKDVKQKVIYR
jgi:spore coat polysaccharide biosynthesis protein SpsF (cytidylyltransferase family)